MNRLLWGLTFLVLISKVYAVNSTVPESVNIGGLFPINLNFPLPDGSVFLLPILPGVKFTFEVAIAAVNDDTSVLPNTVVKSTFVDSFAYPTYAMDGMIKLSQSNSSFAIGPIFTDETVFAAISGAALSLPQLSPACTAQSLESREAFGFFNRLVPADYSQMEALVDILSYFKNLTGQKQWKEVGVYASADSLGVGLTGSFFRVASENEIKILAFQQTLTVQQNNGIYPVNDYQRDIKELKKSGARVFIAFWTAQDFNQIIPVGIKEKIFGDQYVWLCYEGCSDGGIYTNFTDPSFPPIPELNRAVTGMLGLSIPQGITPEYKALKKAYSEFNPASPNIDKYSALVYDSVYAAAIALDMLINQGLELTPNNINAVLKNVTFSGMTGPIAFNPNGNRKTFYNVLNCKLLSDIDCFDCLGINSNNGFVRVGYWDVDTGLNFNGDVPITFYDRTDVIPDLDVRPPFNYWSCPDGKEKTDQTGKTIKIETPDGNDVTNIQEYYYCDGYIDCGNMSDESVDCDTNYTILFIVMGILTSLIVLSILFCVMPFVVLFGVAFPRKVIRLARPLYLLLLCISAILGCISTFAWYGKPNGIACNFQVWLFGLSAGSLVSALYSKMWRIWRMSLTTISYKPISDLEMGVMWVITMIPIVFLLGLWTLISTPTAEMLDGDDHKHYQCTTGGFTGTPGGIVFFFIIVAYLIILILTSFVLAYRSRKSSSKYKERKILNIALFNILFTGVVVIIVFFIVDPIEPFAAWIIRTVGMVYSFFSTIMIVFIPVFTVVVVVDRFKDKKSKKEDDIGNNSAATLSSSSMSHISS